jgi:hypothetical protein
VEQEEQEMNPQLFDDGRTGGEFMALQERVRQVIQPLISTDAEDRVMRSYKQWNQIVREHIRNETALRLSDGIGRNSISVEVVAGFPLSLARLIDEFGDPVLWRIIVGQRKITGVVEGLRFLLSNWPAIENWCDLPQLARDALPHLARTLEVAEMLQQLARAEEVRKQIQNIHTDILGMYLFKPDMPSRVHLYWMPIAMFAAMLDLRIEDLTVVVLTHELTHGYTHIGRDIDGTQWSDLGFAKRDLEVVEGLAQFYTEVVSNRLTSRSPGPLQAYLELLNLQGGPYLAHRQWMNDSPQQTGETVRFAMVSARSQGIVQGDSWIKLLADTRSKLGSAIGH